SGPLDLLLRLVENAQLAITAISLVQVTGQYLEHLRAESAIDHRALADFVAIGARLIELKSRALLPTPPPEPARDGDDGNAPEDLVELLLEYQRYKNAAALLREREENGARAFPRLAAAPNVTELPGLSNVTLDRLVAIVQRALARAAPPPEPPALERPRYSVRKQMAVIRELLLTQGRIGFSAIIARCATREEIITSFLAVLELIKSERLIAVQEGPFQDIVLMVDPSPERASPSVEPSASESELAGVE
ncbi:MAG TPA: segregation/condensation protein A, partial [Dehalococcoidia bacterium]|nr:segregation/condensation protein A [Dehalococcoidia bacterium]